MSGGVPTQTANMVGGFFQNGGRSARAQLPSTAIQPMPGMGRPVSAGMGYRFNPAMFQQQQVTAPAMPQQAFGLLNPMSTQQFVANYNAQQAAANAPGEVFNASSPNWSGE